jgi:hypothetical protein
MTRSSTCIFKPTNHYLYPFQSSKVLVSISIFSSNYSIESHNSNEPQPSHRSKNEFQSLTSKRREAQIVGFNYRSRFRVHSRTYPRLHLSIVYGNLCKFVESRTKFQIVFTYHMKFSIIIPIHRIFPPTSLTQAST